MALVCLFALWANHNDKDDAQKPQDFTKVAALLPFIDELNGQTPTFAPDRIVVGNNNSDEMKNFIEHYQAESGCKYSLNSSTFLVVDDARNYKKIDPWSTKREEHNTVELDYACDDQGTRYLLDFYYIYDSKASKPNGGIRKINSFRPMKEVNNGK